MSKHTPGPWIISIDARYPAEPCVDAVVDNVVWHVALCHNGPGPEDASAEANARLIAAAPELLACLKEALPALRNEMKRQADAFSQMPTEVSAHRAAAARYAAAIAIVEKVEGSGPGDTQGGGARLRRSRNLD